MTNLTEGVIMDTDLKDPRGKLRCLQQAEDEKQNNPNKTNKIQDVTDNCHNVTDKSNNVTDCVTLLHREEKEKRRKR